MLRDRPLVLLLMLVVVFGVGALGGAGLTDALGEPTSGPKVPMPHHVPFAPGAASFRFAMVHDVLHERFPKHGPAFYTERDRVARAKLAALKPDSDEALQLHDDIAVGLDRLGRSGEAVEVMRKKRKLQRDRRLTAIATYETLANLGTFLVHQNFAKLQSGSHEARAAVKEGLEHIRTAIRVNPNAHFGREKWQATVIEFMLNVADKPELLRESDCLGNRLSTQIDVAAFRFRPPDSRVHSHGNGVARSYTPTFATRIAPEFRRLLVAADGDAGAIPPDAAAKVRAGITWVCAEMDHRVNSRGENLNAAPFDEPMLGIIGMWRQGGGANPHFALAIGETMLRVGQRQLAWSAYERAKRLAERYSPDAATVQFLRTHCDGRQAFIESTLRNGETAEWRARFDAELAVGEGYQRAMQEYEAAKIAAGGDVSDPAFLDDFQKDREPISTPPGDEEYVRLEKPHAGLYWRLGMIFATGLLAAGIMAFALTRRRKAKPDPMPSE